MTPEEMVWYFLVGAAMCLMLRQTVRSMQAGIRRARQSPSAAEAARYPCESAHD